MPAYDWSTKLTTGELITCTAVAAATTATAGLYANLEAAAPLAVTASAAVGNALYSARAGATRTAIGVRAASWLTAGGWASFHLAQHTLPSATGWITGACAAILAAGMNYAANATEPARAEKATIMAWKRQAARTSEEWDERLARITKNDGYRVQDVTPWPKEAGYTLTVALPKDGTTFEHLKAYEKGLATELNLPNGCGVEIMQGDSRGIVLIQVSTRDMISETILIEEDFSELSINDPIKFAFHRDGTDALGGLLDDCGIVVGDTGSGKTNLLNVIISRFARMPDTLVWVIDTTGAGVALPWITPWAVKEDGRDVQATAPIVDWVATNVVEATIMLRMAIEIIGVRKARYQKLMRKHNTDKIPVSAELPGIVIVADETAELPQEVQGLIDSVMNTGRATRVRTLNSALRATMDTITAAMKKRAKWRVGMYTEDPEELSYLFSGYQVINTKDAPVPGSGFYTYGRGGMRTFKVERIEPSFITSCCLTTAPRRPVLDKTSCGVELYDKYVTRWKRALPTLYPEEYAEGSLSQEAMAMLADLDGVNASVSLNDGVTDFASSEATAASATAVHGTRAGEVSPVTAAVSDYMNGRPVTEEALQQMFEDVFAMPEADGLAEELQERDDFARVLAETGERVPAPDGVPASVSVKTPQQHALAYVRRAGPKGAGAKEVSEWLEREMGEKVPRTTVQGWLAKWDSTGKLVKMGSGSHTRYASPEHAGEE